MAARSYTWTLSIVLACALACTKSEPAPSTTAAAATPQTEPPVEPAVEAPVEAAPAPAAGPEEQHLFHGLDLTRDATLVGADMAKQWCERGGEAFRPPVKPGDNSDDEYPPRLERCADVEVKQLERHQQGGLTATVLEIDAVQESRDVVLLQTQGHAALVELNHEFEDESGEAGPTWREFSRVELRDITGTPSPEWIAELRFTGGDNFEADRCYASDDDTRLLVVCSETADGFACFMTAFRRTVETTPRAADQLYDCDDPAESLEPPSISGFNTTIEVRRDAVEFVRVKGSDEPPREGVVPLATLFEQDTLAVGSFG